MVALRLGGESDLAFLNPAGRVKEFAVSEAVLSNKKFNSAAIYWAPVIARHGRREEVCIICISRALLFHKWYTLAPGGQLSVWEAPLWGAALISDTVRPFSPISSPQRSQCPSSLRTKGTNLLAAAAGIPENSE